MQKEDYCAKNKKCHVKGEAIMGCNLSFPTHNLGRKLGIITQINRVGLCYMLVCFSQIQLFADVKITAA